MGSSNTASEPATGELPRLFVAVHPPSDVAAHLADLPRGSQQGVRFVRPAHWHVTLRFLGGVEPGDVIGALDGIDPGPARARLGPSVELLSARVLAVPVRGLDALARAVIERTAGIGQPARLPFVGHLTVARISPRAPRPPALGAPVSAEFDVDEIALVQSHLDPAGARHHTLRTWPVH